MDMHYTLCNSVIKCNTILMVGVIAQTAHCYTAIIDAL